MTKRSHIVLFAALAAAGLNARSQEAPPAPPQAPAPEAPTPPALLQDFDDGMLPPLPRMPALAPLPPLPAMPRLAGLAPPAPLPPLPPMAALAALPDLSALTDLPWFALQETPEAPRGRPAMERAREMRSREKDDRDYRAGSAYLDRREYDKAIQAFTRVIDEKSGRADGALYWRAYAQNRLGHRDEALASLANLKSGFPNSRWLDDAKALEVEVRQQSGQPVSPENASDEDLKLLAINSLMNTDPDRSMPLLEKLLKSGAPKLKERALFVLAQARSQKSRDLLAQMARGGSNPDLQLKAVEYLGIFGGKDNLQTLAEVYKGSNDAAVKRAVLRSFMISGSRENLLAAAKSETSPELKLQAIRLLGAAGGSGDLVQLYGNETSPEARRAIIQGLFTGGNSDKLGELARSEKDPALRQEAIRELGLMDRAKTGPALAELYRQESDPKLRRTIVNAFFTQGNAPALIELARKETDAGMKKEMVQRLALMRSKEATEFMMELLNK